MKPHPRSPSPGYTYTYDANGNMLTATQTSTGDVWTYTYDFRNLMTSAVEKNSSGTTLASATFTYDALGNRIGMDENGVQTWTLYDGSNPVMDFTSTGSLETRYLNGPAGDLVDTVLARELSNGTVAWYLSDHLGTVRDIINNTGGIIDHVDYSAFGTTLDESSPSNGDRMTGFAGLQRDTVTGLNLAVFRVQNPGTGRWTSQDPLKFRAGDVNLARYSGNSPTNAADPRGLSYLGNYWYYLTNPGAMDGDLQTGQQIAIGTAITAIGGATVVTGVGLIGTGATIGGSISIGGGTSIGIGGLLVGGGTAVTVTTTTGTIGGAVVVTTGAGVVGAGAGLMYCAAQGPPDKQSLQQQIDELRDEIAEVQEEIKGKLKPTWGYGKNRVPGSEQYLGELMQKLARLLSQKSQCP